jgi:hypothetical protein
MIKYNWEKIMNVTRGDPTSVLLIIHTLTHKRLPNSTRDPAYKYWGKNFSGHSFLLNPEELLVEIKKYSSIEASMYIMIASYRNYLHYKTTRDTTLELIHIPFFTKLINNNRLLRMEDGIIHFKFEDNAKEKNNGN